MSSGTPNELPQRSGTFRAVVQSGHTTTSYLRAGAGRPVVLLSSWGPGHMVYDTLVATLGSAYRLLVPQLPVPHQPLGAWLVPFLDGLGLTQVAVIVDADRAPDLVHFAQVDPDRISRIVILSPDTPSGHVKGPTQPILSLSVEGPAGVLVDRVAWFLAGAPEVLGA